MHSSKATRYMAQIHRQRRRFIVVKDHEVPQIERVVLNGRDYSVIEKVTDLPDGASKLHITNVDNR